MLGYFDHRLPILGLAAAALLAPGAAVAQGAAMAQNFATAQSGSAPVEVRIWLDRGGDIPLQRGERSRVYYRASQDAYVAVLRVDTDGKLRLLFPSGPQEEHRLRGGRDYRLLFNGEGDWAVEEAAGVGYFFIVASPTPFDWGRFAIAPSGGWEFSGEGIHLKQDPHLAVSEVAGLLLGGEGRSYGLDFTAYHVGQNYSYPRFLCYQCHTEQALTEWNPYRLACEAYRIVVYNDPYFYPSTRYQGTRVLFPEANEPALPQFAFSTRLGGEPTTPQVVDRSGVTGREMRVLAAQPGVTGVLVRRLEESGAILAASEARSPEAAPGESGGRGMVAGTPVPVTTGGGAVVVPTSSDRPTLQRRPARR